jgi:hypothetical protein
VATPAGIENGAASAIDGVSRAEREAGEGAYPSIGRDNPAIAGGVDHSIDRADDLGPALARALSAAVDAGRLDVVAMLADELVANHDRASSLSAKFRIGRTEPDTL